MQQGHTQHPFYRLIQAYYDGCNRQDAALLRSVLAPDVEHYTTDMERVSGVEPLIAFFCSFAPAVKAHWMIDHCLVQEPEAVIEWTMRWHPTRAGAELKRGAEWYVFEDGRIKEIRAYYTNPHAKPNLARASLKGFDYAARGYSALDSTHDLR